MTVLQALVLGIVQGLAEFLPVSSSAHLTLLPWALGWEDPGLAFDVALHLGTLVALLAYFRAEWVELARAAASVVRSGGRASTSAERRVVFLVVATIPGAIAGLLLEKKAEHAFRAPLLIAAALAVMGVLLWAVDRAAATDRPLATMRTRDAVVIGFAQILALIPGVSRSGSTITAGRALRFDREGAAVFSFLLSMPLIAGAGLRKLPQMLHDGLTPALVVGIVAAALSSWFSIAVVLRYVRTHSYGAFAVYRVVLAAGVVVLWFARARA